jgi:hypothetical protein
MRGWGGGEVEPGPTSFPLGAQAAPVVPKSLEELEWPQPCALSIELVRGYDLGVAAGTSKDLGMCLWP